MGVNDFDVAGCEGKISGAHQCMQSSFGAEGSTLMDTQPVRAEQLWYAVYTLPQNERAVAQHLDLRGIECFLPTCKTMRVWKNRQRVQVERALFPAYVFVRIESGDRRSVLQSPGVVRILGDRRGPIPVQTHEIEFLRSDFCRQRLEPYPELIVGRRVRVQCGPLQGVEGVLVQRKGSLRFVLTLELINQHAAVEVHAGQIEPTADNKIGHIRLS